MHDQILVGIVDRRAYSLKQSQSFGDRQLPPVAVHIDRQAIHIVHDQVGKPILGRASVQQFHDVGVVQRRECLALLLKSMEDFLTVQSGFDHLDGGSFLELIVGASGQIDRPHAAAPDLAH